MAFKIVAIHFVLRKCLYGDESAFLVGLALIRGLNFTLEIFWPVHAGLDLACVHNRSRDVGAKFQVGDLMIKRQPFAYFPGKFHNKYSENYLFQCYFGKSGGWL